MPFQGDFFDKAELEQTLSDVQQQLAEAGKTPCSKPARKKREGFSDKLPRVRVDLTLSDEEKAGASRTFFTKIKEELDIVQAKAQVIEYWQEKPEQKTEQRQQLAQPVLDDLKTWSQTNASRAPKDSLTSKAITYTLNQWDYLIGYIGNGKLQISNALAENAIRPFAVGRRNWLFADTSRGTHASATVYSLIETAKAAGLEPYEYLRHVLMHIAAADTVEKTEALLPWNAKTDRVQ